MPQKYPEAFRSGGCMTELSTGADSVWPHQPKAPEPCRVPFVFGVLTTGLALAAVVPVGISPKGNWLLSGVVPVAARSRRRVGQDL